MDPSLPIAELVHACFVQNDAGAWRKFVSRFQRPVNLSIIRIARRWGAFPQEVVDDLAQETFLKLCSDKSLRLYHFAVEHPDSVEAYIKTVAVNVAHDYFKAHHSQKRGSGTVVQFLDNVSAIAPHSTTGGVEAIQRELLLSEIDGCLQNTPEGPGKTRDRLIFWLYYRQGMSANFIATLPAVGLTVKGVESALRRLTCMVRGRIAG